MAHLDTTSEDRPTVFGARADKGSARFTKRLAEHPPAVRKAASIQLLRLAASPELIKSSRATALEVLTYETLSDGPANRGQIRAALQLLKILDTVETARRADTTVNGQIERLNKLAGTVADPALADAYRQQTAELVEQHPRPSDVAALRKAATDRRTHAEHASTGAESWAAYQAAATAEAEADRMEDKLKAAGIPLTPTSSAGGHFRGLASQVRSLHGQIDDVFEQMGHPRPNHVTKIDKATGTIDRWAALAEDYADVASRTKTLQNTVIATGPRRIRSQPDMVKAAAHDADLGLAAHYRRQADTTSDRVLRDGYTQLAAEIEDRIKKGHQS